MYLAEIGAPDDEWDRETAAELVESLRDVPAVARDEELLRYAAHPVMSFMIKFAVKLWPGMDSSEDATWAATVALARREIAVNRDAGIDGGLGELNLGVLDWIEGRIGRWDDQAFPSLVRARVDGLLDARRRGRERGMRLRQRDSPVTSPPPTSTGWALRHPSDHYFRSARDSASDERLCELLDAQISLLADSYDQLAAQAAQEPADLVIELGVLHPVASGWSQPVATTVLAVETGAASVGDQLGLRLVADPAATFNGTLISVRAGERWLTYANRLQDETIVPTDGTRRTAA